MTDKKTTRQKVEEAKGRLEEVKREIEFLEKERNSLMGSYKQTAVAENWEQLSQIGAALSGVGMALATYMLEADSLKDVINLTPLRVRLPGGRELQVASRAQYVWRCYTDRSQIVLVDEDHAELIYPDEEGSD